MGHGPSSRGRVVLVAWVTLAVLAAGCSGSANDASDGKTPSGSQSATGSSTGSGTTSASPSPTKTKKKRNVVAWVLSLGPGAPEGPPEFTAYRELQQLHCATVFDRVAELTEPARTLYQGAARACLAAFNGREELWAQSDAAYDAVAGRRGELNCMDQAAFALLARLVTLHREFPGRAFQSAPTSAAKAPPCPTVRALTPDHGPAKTVVRLTGRHLGGRVVGVQIVDSSGSSQPAADLTKVPGGLQFTMPDAPPADTSATVCVVVRAKPDWSADGVLFTYESSDAGPATAFDCPPPEAS